MHSPDIVKRALQLVEDHGGVARAHRALVAELKAQGLTAPCYATIWGWVSKREDVMRNIEAQEKRKMTAISGEVAIDAAERMLQALPNLSDGQVPVAYGIAMQRRADWESAGQKAPLVAMQFRFTQKDGTVLKVIGNEDAQD